MSDTIIACRAQLSPGCWHGEPYTGHLARNGVALDTVTGTIVCSPCFSELGCPDDDVLPAAIANEWHRRGRKPPYPVCDFCDRQPATIAYPAHDVTTDLDVGPSASLTSTSLGAWCACPACAVLVDRADRDGLVERSMATVLATGVQLKPGADRARINAKVRVALRTLQDDFWKSRRGAGVPVAEWREEQ